MKYIYEEPKGLIERIVAYAHAVRADGVLCLDDKIKDEPNEFLKILLYELLENLSLDRLKSYKKFIKYYIKELQGSKKKKYKIKKQLKMIYIGFKLILEEKPLHQIGGELYKFYPSEEVIKIGDYIRTTGAESSIIYYGEVTALDENIGMVFLSQLNNDEDLVIEKEQVTHNFGQSDKLKSFIKCYAIK